MTRPDAPAGDPHEQLRALIHDAVDLVEPRPALATIQSRTKVTTMNSKRPWIAVAAGAVAATALTVVTVNLVGNDGSDPRTDGPAATQTPTPTGTGSPDPSPTAPSTEQRAVPAYYVGETARGPRLYREFISLDVPAGTPAVVEAVDASLQGEALDPDYFSPWSDLGVSADSASYEGGTLTVSIDGPASLRERPAGMSKALASMAIEQVLYTALAELGEGYDVPVQLLLSGARTDMLLGVPVAEPLAAGDPLDVRSTVAIFEPVEGASVDAPFTVTGEGAFFEANVSWQLLDGTTVVEEGFAMAKECCTLSPYTFTVDAAPGTYTLRVYDADMSGGAEGSGEAEDTKTVTVR